MKFSSIIKGVRAERKVEIPGFFIEDKPVVAMMRALSGAEEASVLRLALEGAVVKGVDKPTPGDPLYDFGVMANTLALSFLDTESPENDRKPFFDKGAEQVLADLPRETIVFLYERQVLWQGECSPYHRNLDGKELIAQVREVASSEDDLPFTCMRPATRWIFTRTLARQLLNSLEPSSSSTSPSTG